MPIFKLIIFLLISQNVIQDFLLCLDKFLTVVILDDNIHQELRELVVKFKFVQKLFYKYEELFLKLSLKNEYFILFCFKLRKLNFIERMSQKKKSRFSII